jgi:hypothetical protein
VEDGGVRRQESPNAMPAPAQVELSAEFDQSSEQLLNQLNVRRGRRLRRIECGKIRAPIPAQGMRRRRQKRLSALAGALLIQTPVVAVARA